MFRGKAKAPLLGESVCKRGSREIMSLGYISPGRDIVRRDR